MMGWWVSVRIPISWISTSLMEKKQSITKQQNDPKTVWFWYGLTRPAWQQWPHLRRKSLILLELVTLPDATTMRSLAPPVLRNHKMPKKNQPSQLHARSKLWHFSLCSVAERPSNLDFWCSSSLLLATFYIDYILYHISLLSDLALPVATLNHISLHVTLVSIYADCLQYKWHWANCLQHSIPRQIRWYIFSHAKTIGTARP